MSHTKHIKFWRPFKDAREWARSLALSSEKQWRIYKKDGLPEGIPSNPNRTYANEWKGWSDWLGSGNHITNPSKYYKKNFRSYSEAQKWAIEQKITSLTMWREICKKGLLPSDIPTAPYKRYASEWKGWGVFLGTGFIPFKNRKWMSFARAKSWARKNNIRSREAWFQAKKNNLLPNNIPVLADRVYREEWKGWSDFLGVKLKGGSSYIESIIEFELKHFLPVNSTARSILLTNGKRKRVDIVISTHNLIIEYDGYHWHKDFVEKDLKESKMLASIGWRVVRLREKPLLKICKNDLLVNSYDSPFKKVSTLLEHLIKLEIIEKEGVSRAREYIKNKKLYCIDSPIFNSYDWLPFKKARAWVQKQKIRSETQWRKFRSQLPKNIPSSPEVVYQIEWKGWGDWLGTGTQYVQPNSFRSFSSARKWARLQRLSSSRDWLRLCRDKRIPADIPNTPNDVYKEWISWGDWLFGGVDSNRRKPWLSYTQARKYVHKLKLKSETDWRIFLKSNTLPINIPKSPRATYKDDWISWPHWLGTENRTKKKIILNYEEASKWAVGKRIKTSTEWRDLFKKGQIPIGFPSDPARVYKDKWVSWKSFLQR